VDDAHHPLFLFNKSLLQAEVVMEVQN